MKASFFGFDVALSGLYASQKSIDVTNNNIVNASTPGYSRQVAYQSASTPISLKDGKGMVGTGVKTYQVARVRNEYLDSKYWNENPASGEWNVKDTVFKDVAAVINEPSDSSFTTVVNNFFTSMQELSKNPSSMQVRALVKENAKTFITFFNSTSTKLENLQEDYNNSIRSKVDEINSYSEQIRSLNEQIYRSELSGDMANTLRDQRTLVLDKLSKISDVQANEVQIGTLPDGRPDLRYQVTLNGRYLVNHFDKYDLKYTVRGAKANPEDIDGLYDLSWEDGTKFVPKGGELKGYYDARDGISDGVGNDFRGIPYYIRKMNQFVQVFSKALNEGFRDYNNNGTVDAGEDFAGHADGYTLKGTTGIRFFTTNNTNSATFIGAAVTPDDINALYSNITAKNLSLSKDITDDISNIFVSTNAGDKENGKAVLDLISFRHDMAMFNEGSPEDFMRVVVSTMGVDSQESSRMVDNQETVLKQVENRRQSVAGVSLDEEMANIVKFQHAYNAAAKLISTYSQLYDTLINKI